MRADNPEMNYSSWPEIWTEDQDGAGCELNVIMSASAADDVSWYKKYFRLWPI